MSENNSIVVENGKFGYQKGDSQTVILDKVDLDFKGGEFVGIVGLNGSGKSTFIRSISAIQPLLGGKVSINGKNISEIRRTELAKEISIVLTEKVSGFNLKCCDAIAAGRLPYTDLFHTLEENDRKIVNDCLHLLGLEKHKDKLLTELSDGLYQKTMIARALAQETGTMLLDEPGAFLDFASKHELFIMLAKLCLEKHKCILVSSHELDLLLKYCKKIILVKDGSFVVTSTGAAIEHPIFREISGGFI
jgi:iron complex transport system ATP-binding protein